MRLETRTIDQAQDTILLHNVADAGGRRTLRKGTRLTEEHLAQLAEMGRTTVEVAILDAGDAHEDEAALALAEAMQAPHLSLTRATGGRVNLRTAVDGLLVVDAERLLAVNSLPGFAVATRRQHTVVGPNQETDNVASLKIVPYAVARRDLEYAIELASERPGIVEVRPFQPGRRVALLVVAEPAAQERTRDEYLSPTETRLARLQAEMIAVEAGNQICSDRRGTQSRQTRKTDSDRPHCPR